MSREWLRSIIDRRQEAFKNFTHSDNETVPLKTDTLLKLNTLKPTSAIIVTGYIPVDAIRFSVNLKCKTSGNIALHFNPRLDRGYVVRNTKIGGSWDDEETCSPLSSKGYIFKKDSYFHLTIFCSLNEFQIAVDGEHFCAFSYRFSLEDIIGLEINDDVEETRVRQTTLAIYPDPEICKPTRILALSDSQPIDKNLEIPVTIELKKGFNVGTKLLIKGRLKLLPHSFFINLQKGKTIYPHPTVALHINPRFHYGNYPSCVVLNCWTNGKWDKEERHEGQLSWAPGREFSFAIRCEYGFYSLWLNDKMIGEFRHRMEPTEVDTIRIIGDLIIYEISITY